MRLALPATLFGLSLLLGGAMAYEIAAPLDPVKVEAPLSKRRAPRMVAVVPYVPPTEDSFADIDARPLFASTRKPLTDPAEANGAAGPASDFALVGVIMGGERAVALVKIKSTSATLSAIVGGTVNGWRVARIDATTVTLHANGSDVTIPLETPGGAPPSAPLQPLQPAGAPVAAATPAPAAPQPTPPIQTPGAPAAAPQPGGAQPGAPAKPYHPTIAPEALKGAPIDPKTGEPTL